MKAGEIISKAKKNKEDKKNAKEEEKKTKEKAELETRKEKNESDGFASEANVAKDRPPVALHIEADDEHPEPNRSTESRQQEGQTANPEPGASENDRNVEVIRVVAGAARIANQRQNEQSGSIERQVVRTGNFQDDATNEEFPTVAAAHAGPIGISLNAPANEDPSVIQAACDSTGIVPTFLSPYLRKCALKCLINCSNQRTMRLRQLLAHPGNRYPQSIRTSWLLPPDLRAQVLEAEVEYQTRNA